jgi:probable HAF family extracellular repeat protein
MKLIVVVSISLAFVATSASQPRYYVKDLGVWEGVAMNNAGTIVGWRANAASWDSVVYDGGRLRLLAKNVAVQAMNNSGTMIGALTDTNNYWLDWVYQRGTSRVLDSNPDAILSGINNSGQICGYDRAAVTSCIYTKNRRIVLPALDGISWAVAIGINDSGQVVGSSGPLGPTGQGHAVLWSNGRVVDLGFSGYAQKINNSGQVIGFNVTKLDPLSIHAVLYSAGTLTDFGEGDAIDINNVGQVIGWNVDPDTQVYTTFLYSNGMKYGLNALIGSTMELGLKAINESGQILAVGVDPQGIVHTYLLIPVAAA